jgi:hypothetical protein
MVYLDRERERRVLIHLANGLAECR